MEIQNKTNAELINELGELLIQNNSLKAIVKNLEIELIHSNKKNVFQNEEKQKREDELVIDITQHKQAEQAIKESEEKFRDLSNNISQLAWIADTQGYIL